MKIRTYHIAKGINKFSKGNSAKCFVAAWIGGEFGGEWIHVYVWLNPSAVHLKLSQHCSSAVCCAGPESEVQIWEETNHSSNSTNYRSSDTQTPRFCLLDYDKGYGVKCE